MTKTANGHTTATMMLIGFFKRCWQMGGRRMIGKTWLKKAAHNKTVWRR